MLFSDSSLAHAVKKNIARIILFSYVFMTLEPAFGNILKTSHDVSSFHFNESVTDIRINREKAGDPWLMDMLFMDREHNEKVDSEGKEEIFEPRSDDQPFFYAHENDPSTLQQGYVSGSDDDEDEDVGETIQSILSQEGTAHYTRFEQHKLREGLGGLKYRDIQEIFEGTTSIGCMYTLEDIGRLSLFWNGDAQLDGSEYAHIPSQKSLKLNLPGTRLHVFNTNLKDLWVEGAHVSLSRKNTFERLILKSQDNQKHEIIFNEGSSTHFQHLSTDYAVVNRGDVCVAAKGALS